MSKDRAALLAIAQGIAEAENRAGQLRERVERLRNEGSDSAQAQEALHADEALLTIYVSSERVYLWAVPKSGAPVFALSPLSRKDIESAVKTLRASLDTDATTL